MKVLLGSSSSRPAMQVTHFNVKRIADPVIIREVFIKMLNQCVKVIPSRTPWEPVADPLWSADPSLKTTVSVAVAVS